MKTIQYKKGLFEHGNNVFIANEVVPGMIIALKNNKYFYVDDVDSEFINDEVAELYTDDDTDILPEHTTITFYDEDENEIRGVLGTELCICFVRGDGKHCEYEE